MKPPVRILLLLAIAILVFLFFSKGLHHHLSLENIKEHQAVLQNFYAEQPVMMVAAFTAVYILVVALNLPGAVVLGLSAGALFGSLAGTVLISFASSFGALLACLLSRYLMRDWVQQHFREKLDRVNKGINEQGPFYLFALQLMPIIPFFVINMVMGLTTMRLWTFFWVSQLGMLPGTAVFVNAGSQIGKIDSISGILSPALILSLALVGIFPLLVRRLLAHFRIQHNTTPSPTEAGFCRKADTPAQTPGPLLEKILKSCTDCGACQKSCRFLADYGTPKQMAQRFDFSSPKDQGLAYECSLCGLCTAICPEKLDIPGLFLDIRQCCVENQIFDKAAYKVILGYEKRGTSPLFSWYGLPKECDTVFFPGCSLPGTRPAVTMALFQQLQKSIPSLGMVLDCCTKPSHDLGRKTYFNGMFKEMKEFLASNGIRHILTACPNCTKVFRLYGQGFTVQTVYEVLQKETFPSLSGPGKTFSLHDPCAVRKDALTHQAIRNLLTDMGHTVAEMKHRGNRTLCCGEGGTVAAVNPNFARTWAKLRGQEAKGNPILTYCAGCAGFLNRVTPTFHIVDLLYDTEAVLGGNPKVARAPITYWNRLRLKQQVKRLIQPAVQRTRPSNISFQPGPAAPALKQLNPSKRV